MGKKPLEEAIIAGQDRKALLCQKLRVQEIAYVDEMAILRIKERDLDWKKTIKENALNDYVRSKTVERKKTKNKRGNEDSPQSKKATKRCNVM
jgi:hypothetical protein